MSVANSWPNPWPTITAKQLYEQNYTEYSRGSLKIQIQLSGASILVETGHSLSLYSKILYDNYSELNVFGRSNINSNGFPQRLVELDPIVDKNFLKKGETLYFAPDLYDPTRLKEAQSTQPSVSTLPTMPPPQVQAPAGLEIVAADCYDISGIGEATTTAFGGIYVVYFSLDQFVQFVTASLLGRKIGILHIQSHGSDSGDGILFGDVFNKGVFGDYYRSGDKLTMSNFPSHRSKLNELTPHFAQGAWVAVRACNVGQNLALMRALRSLWSINLVAGLGKWNNGLDQNEKEFLVLEANGSEYLTKTMPPQIQHSLMRKFWRGLEIPKF